MKKIVRHVLPVMMCIVLVFASLQITVKSVSATETVTSGDWEYSVLEDGTVEIENYFGTDSEIIVPKELDGKSVTKLGSNVFSQCSNRLNITKVVLQEGLTTIGNSSFSYCYNLAEIEIPDTVTEIRRYAFSNCGKLRSIDFPAGLKKICSEMFYMTGITHVNIPEGVECIEEDAFYHCTYLREITLPDSISEVDYNAFNFCENLRSINVSESNLNFSTYDGALYSKDKTKFLLCPTGRETIKIYEGVKSIENGAFYASYAAYLDIPEGVESIGEYAFDCDLVEINIPSTVETIDENAFIDCYGVKIYGYPDTVAETVAETMADVKKFTFVEGKGIFACDVTIDTEMFLYDGSDAIRPEVSVEYNGEQLEESVDYTMEYSNNTCSGYGTVSFEGIGDFKGTTQKEFFIADEFCSYTDGTTPSFTHVVQNDVAKVYVDIYFNAEAFDDYTEHVVRITDSSGNEEYISFGGIWANKKIDIDGDGNYDVGGVDSGVTHKEMPEGKKHLTLTVSGKGSTIEFYCTSFEDYEGVQYGLKIEDEPEFEYKLLDDGTLEVTKNHCISSEPHIPNQIDGIPVTSIGDKLFYRCNTINSIELPNGITRIGTDAFYFVENLNSVIIPDSVKEIGEYAFHHNGLESITIPASVETIGDYAMGLRLENYTYVPIEEFVIYGCKDSAAETYAKDNGITFIEAKDITDCTIEINPETFVYDGTEKEPVVTVKNGTETLNEGVEYIVSIDDNTNAGTATVTITGKKGYLGKVTKTFDISKAEQVVEAEIDRSVIIVGNTTEITAEGIGNITYSSDDEGVATVSSDGVVRGISAGTAVITVTASGDNNHAAGTTTVSVTVNNPTPVSECTVSLSASSYKYDKTAKKPTVTVKDETKTLVNGTDYTVTYSDNIHTGTAKVIITGKGDYAGTITKTFTITATGKGGDNATWNFNSKTGAFTVTGTGDMYEYQYSSNTPWFNFKTEIKTVNIASGITSVGTNAFYGCTSLTKVTGCANVTTIGINTFRNCTALTSVAGCSKVTVVNQYAFCGSTSFATLGATTGTVSLPAATKIGGYAFYQCGGIKILKTYSPLTYIGTSAFRNCGALTTASIGAVCETIASYAFCGDTALTTVNGCARVKGIGAYAFWGDTALKSVGGMSKVTSIGNYAFYNCAKLETVGWVTGKVQFNAVNGIGTYAFSGCKQMTYFMAGASLIRIQTYAFNGASSLKTIYLKTTKLRTVGTNAFKGINTLATIYVPSAKLTSYKNGHLRNKGQATTVTVKAY